MRYSVIILALAAAVLASPTGTPPTSGTPPPDCPEDGGEKPPTSPPTAPPSTPPSTPPSNPPSTPPSTGPATVCPNGLYSIAQCCATDVLGAVGLNCATPATAVTSPDNFIETCAKTGQQAKCCVVPVAGQDLLCTNVSPSGL